MSFIPLILMKSSEQHQTILSLVTGGAYNCSQQPQNLNLSKSSLEIKLQKPKLLGHTTASTTYNRDINPVFLLDFPHANQNITLYIGLPQLKPRVVVALRMQNNLFK